MFFNILAFFSSITALWNINNEKVYKVKCKIHTVDVGKQNYLTMLYFEMKYDAIIDDANPIYVIL
jgi:hypothetical protein